MQMHPGFNTGNVLVARVSMPASNASAEQVLSVWRQMSRQFATIPGVEAASISASSVPMTDDFSTLPFRVDGQPKPATPAEMQWAHSGTTRRFSHRARRLVARPRRKLPRQGSESSRLPDTIDMRHLSMLRSY
ncbi:MAG TPA: hypothetical protein VNG89_25755, partial [Vicinamibacterales bacterium]|nr:hypothetical protein [Vicinamibacterales bacterium]